MENARKIIKNDEFERFENLIETLNEISVDLIIKIKDILPCFSNFSCDNRTTKTKNSSILTNVNQMERMVKTSSGIDKIKMCFYHANGDQSDNLNVLFFIHSELKKQTNIIDINTSDDLVEVLKRCYSIKNSSSETVLAKSLANSFIMAVSERIFEKKCGLLQKSDNANFMGKNFKKIFKSISNNTKIVISDEKKFYELLNKHYSVVTFDDVSKEEKSDESFDVMKIVKEGISKHNNKIIELKDPINIEANEFLEYLLNTSVEELDYEKFPSYDNVNCLKLISLVRQKLVSDEHLDELVEKLAILDIYHASYYKHDFGAKIEYIDDSVTKKTNKKLA